MNNLDFSDLKSIVLAVVLGVVIPVAVIIIVVVFLICFLTRPRQDKDPSPSVNETVGRPVPLEDFIKHVERMAKDSNLEFSNEYDVNIAYAFNGFNSLTSFLQGLSLLYRVGKHYKYQWMDGQRRS